MAIKRPPGANSRIVLVDSQGERMIFDQFDEGEYRIYAGAMEGACGDGYIAALVVDHVDHVGKRGRCREVFRDESLSCGHRWRSAKEALASALNRGREVAHVQMAARSDRERVGPQPAPSRVADNAAIVQAAGTRGARTVLLLRSAAARPTVTTTPTPTPTTS